MILFYIFAIIQFISSKRLIIKKEEIRKKDWQETFLITPIKNIGRSLWLIIDFLLIKRAIIRPSAIINQCVINNYKKIEEKDYLWLFLGLAILLCIIGIKAYE